MLLVVAVVVEVEVVEVVVAAAAERIKPNATCWAHATSSPELS